MPENKRRSLLYAPADRPDAVERAVGTDADGVILDLESTVEDGNKDEARENVGQFLSDLDFDDKESVVRINDLTSDRWLGDVEAAIEAGVDTLRLPKIEQPGQVETAVEAARQFASPPPEFLIQLETPRGLLNGPGIATACADLPSVTGVGVGIGDYTTALDVPEHTPELRAFVLNQSAAVAAAGDMDGLAYVHKDVEDLREAATLAKELGHVGQPISYKVDPDEFIAVIHDVYDG